MSTARSKILQQLWASPEKCSLTDHQKELAGMLDSSKDLKIYGSIGSGKTFSVRHFLRSNGIPFTYIAASELLSSPAQDGLKKKAADTDVIVVDNFDTIPRKREHLDQIHQNIEEVVDPYSQSLWILLPSRFSHDWFETVIAGMHSAKIDINRINQITVDHVLSNLEEFIGRPEPTPELRESPASTYGYHTITNAFIAARSNS